MGVRTEADEKIDRAQLAIVEAQEALEDVVFNRCPGALDYKADFSSFLAKTYGKLSKMRRKLFEWRGEE
jgi:hypothetical protein